MLINIAFQLLLCHTKMESSFTYPEVTWLSTLKLTELLHLATYSRNHHFILFAKFEGLKV